VVGWPDTREDLEDLQRRLALEEPEPWTPLPELPTVGVTDRPLVARPDDRERLVLEGREVGRAVVTRRGARPVFAHAAWRTDAEVAAAVVRVAARRARTPEPLRRARYLARSMRARDEGRLPDALSRERAGG
jgi:hypothetical protein